MRCLCETKETLHLKVEGDVGADPIWCHNCGCNLDIEEAPFPDYIKEELMKWALLYGEWIDWEKDRLRPNGVELEKIHNQLGQKLTEKLKKEVGSKYKVTFLPSSSASCYANTGLEL